MISSSTDHTHALGLVMTLDIHKRWTQYLNPNTTLPRTTIPSTQAVRFIRSGGEGGGSYVWVVHEDLITLIYLIHRPVNNTLLVM